MNKPHINLDTLLHDLFLATVTGAALFVKNPASQRQAGTLIDLANAILSEHAVSLTGSVAEGTTSPGSAQDSFSGTLTVKS